MKLGRLFKRNVHRVFRYPFADTFLLFGFFIAFLALYVALSIIQDVENYEKDASAFGYKRTGVMCVSGDQFGFEWKEKIEGCSAVITDYMIVLESESKSILTSMDIVLSSEASPKIYSLNVAMKGVFIGRAVAEALSVHQGETVTINAVPYEVSQVIKTENSGYLDNMVMIDYDSLQAESLAMLSEEKEWEVLIGTDHDVPQQIYDQLIAELKKDYPNCSFSFVEGQEDKDNIPPKTEGLFYFLIYAFALLNCMVAADLWMHVRKKEIAVKRGVGYSLFQLYRDFFWQSFRLCSLSALICYVIQKVFSLLGGSFLGIHLHFSAYNLMIIVVFCVGTSFLSIAFALRNTFRSVREQLALGVEI